MRASLGLTGRALRVSWRERGSPLLQIRRRTINRPSNHSFNTPPGRRDTVVPARHTTRPLFTLLALTHHRRLAVLLLRPGPPAVTRRRITAAYRPCSRLQLGARKVSSSPGEEVLSATHPRSSGYAILAAAWEPIHPALWDADSRVPSGTRSLALIRSDTSLAPERTSSFASSSPLPDGGFLSASHTLCFRR